MINGHQMTVVWHVDNLKVLHIDTREVEKFVQQMEETFGKDTPLTVSCGHVHDYLGMALDFHNKGEVCINMEHYINMMIQDAPKEMEGTSSMPAASHLFKINSKDPQLCMMFYYRCCGQNNFLRSRAGWIQCPWSTKTTPAQFC